MLGNLKIGAIESGHGDLVNIRDESHFGLFINYVKKIVNNILGIKENVKENINSYLMEYLGLSNTIYKSLEEHLSGKNFSVQELLFEGIQEFFLTNFPNVITRVYNYNERKKILNPCSSMFNDEINICEIEQEKFLLKISSTNNKESNFFISKFFKNQDCGGVAALKFNTSAGIFIFSFARKNDCNYSEFKKDLSKIHNLFIHGGFCSIIDEKSKVIDTKYRYPLTGLLNKEYVNSLPHDSKLSVVIMDIDRFKKINDDYGHYIGDKVLIEVAKVLEKTTRMDEVIACHLSGDEYMLLIDNNDKEQILIIIQRINENLKNIKISVKNGEVINGISLSAGICLYKEGLPLEVIKVLADENLSSNKEKSGGKEYRIAADFSKLPYNRKDVCMKDLAIKSTPKDLEIILKCVLDSGKISKERINEILEGK